MKALEPRTLAEALPNRRYWGMGEKGRVEFSFSQLLVVGEVVSVTEGPTFRHTDDFKLVPVDFDDPEAAERTVDVRVQVRESYGPEGRQPPPSADFFFRLGGLADMGPEDRAQHMAGLEALGHVVLVLKIRKDRDGPAYIPLLRGGLIGKVSGAGQISFPALGADASAFVKDLSSLEALRQVAGQPSQVDAWPPSEQP